MLEKLTRAQESSGKPTPGALGNTQRRTRSQSAEWGTWRPRPKWEVFLCKKGWGTPRKEAPACLLCVCACMRVSKHISIQRLGLLARGTAQVLCVYATTSGSVIVWGAWAEMDQSLLPCLLLRSFLSVFCFVQSQCAHIYRILVEFICFILIPYKPVF